MLRPISLLSALLLCGLACHKSSDSNTVADTHADSSEPTTEGAASTSEPRDRSITVSRAGAHVPHEVELDPRGEVALTLDVHGGLRLWPAIRSGDAALSSPYSLPIQDPLWMSLAQADEGFVIAIIDTSNAAQVLALTPSEDGREAKLSPLFETPPSDPLLELHALDGGERFLALGVDHRVRLYDRHGALLSAIDERSFAPWQLRVVHAEAGQAPKIAAVLAQPVRVQALELSDDRLSIASEARSVELDRGPNRNDLLLSPNGETVAALRRQRSRHKEFSVELIDLRSGERRLVAGKADSTIRARMHFVDGSRLLLETGSKTGRGLWVELDKAEALGDPADADPDSKLARRLYKTKHDSIPLAASAELRPEWFDPEWDPPWDHGERFHASVVAGLRVNIERFGGTKLIVDPLDSDRHLAIAMGDRVTVPSAALDHEGARLALAGPSELRVIDVDDGHAVLDELAHGLGKIRTIAFTGPDHVVLVDEKGRLELFELPAGEVVASTKLEFTWAIEGVAYHSSGELGWSSTSPRAPARLLAIEGGQLGAVTELGRARRPQWLDILELSDAQAAALFGMTEAEAYEDLDEYAGAPDGRLFYTHKHPRTALFVREGSELGSFRLPAGQGRQLSPSPDGSKIAVIQFRARDDGRGVDTLLSVLDAASGERLWTLGSPRSKQALAWSGDGRRLAVDATVRSAATGEAVSPASPAGPGAGFTIEDRADADWARQKP